MKRRQFLTIAAATSLIPLIPTGAMAAVSFTPGIVTKALENDEVVFLVFNTEWCSTCAAQERTISALKSEHPEYEKEITFIDVDWDQHSKSKLAKSLRIPRRSTLVVLKGNKELGRIVAGTSTKDIKALMDTALMAAKS